MSGRLRIEASVTHDDSQCCIDAVLHVGRLTWRGRGYLDTENALDLSRPRRAMALATNAAMAEAIGRAVLDSDMHPIATKDFRRLWLPFRQLAAEKSLAADGYSEWNHDAELSNEDMILWRRLMVPLGVAREVPLRDGRVVEMGNRYGAGVYWSEARERYVFVSYDRFDTDTAPRVVLVCGVDKELVDEPYACDIETPGGLFLVGVDLNNDLSWVSKIPAEGCTPEVLWDSAPKTIEAKK